jgi:hypothetical protein
MKGKIWVHNAGCLCYSTGLKKYHVEYKSREMPGPHYTGRKCEKNTVTAVHWWRKEQEELVSRQQKN